MPAARKPKLEPEPEYGSKEDAASRGHVSLTTVNRWIKTGKVRTERDGLNPRVRVRLDDIDKLLSAAANGSRG